MADLDHRLKAIQCSDVILATLQAAFGQDNLVNGTNPYRFIPADPKNSAVWICDPDQRLDQRDGTSQIITVARGEFSPQELGLYNDAGRDESGYGRVQLDLAYVPIYVLCEASNKLASETLASIVYNVLKLFRRDIMREFNIHSLKIIGIAPPAKNRDVPGTPWTTAVTLRLEVAEKAVMTEVTNQLNKVSLTLALPDGTKRVIKSLDA